MVKLRSYMVLHEDTMETLSQYLGISRQTLSGRMNGHSRFKTDEVMLIADRYGLGSKDIIDIFFKEERL